MGKAISTKTTLPPWVEQRDVFFKYVNSSMGNSLCVLVAGYERVTPDTPPKLPPAFSRFTLHYCLGGKGEFRTMGKTYVIGKDDIFVFFPNETIAYHQDPNDPWRYIWFEFVGEEAPGLLQRAKLTKSNPVYHVRSSSALSYLFEAFYHIRSLSDDLFCLGSLQQFFGSLVNERSEESIERVADSKPLLTDTIHYIHVHFSDPDLSLHQISDHFHLSKNYLSRFFRTETGSTVTQYILSLRIAKATGLLKSGNATVKEIATSIGFRDPLYFSRKFRAAMNFAPSAYRSIHAAEGGKETEIE